MPPPKNHKSEPLDPDKESALVTALSHAGVIQADAVVVRGYLGRSDLISSAAEFLRANKLGEIKVDEDALKKALPRRLYLSPRLDRYVEFDDKDVLAYSSQKDENPHAEDIYTIWLSTKRTYMVTAVGPLSSTRGFVRGELVEDYLSRPESRHTAWDEQEYGPTTGKSSNRYCVG